MQRYINIRLHDNDIPHYTQFDLYDPIFAGSYKFYKKSLAQSRSFTSTYRNLT